MVLGMPDPDVTVKVFGDVQVIDHPNVMKEGTFPEERTERGDEYDLDKGQHTVEIGGKTVRFIVHDP